MRMMAGQSEQPKCDSWPNDIILYRSCVNTSATVLWHVSYRMCANATRIVKVNTQPNSSKRRGNRIGDKNIHREPASSNRVKVYFGFYTLLTLHSNHSLTVFFGKAPGRGI